LVEEEFMSVAMRIVVLHKQLLLCSQWFATCSSCCALLWLY